MLTYSLVLHYCHASVNQTKVYPVDIAHMIAWCDLAIAQHSA